MEQSENLNASMGEEGRVKLIAAATGKERGPGSRGPVFYNPAMVQNRDLSLIIIQCLVDSDYFSGSDPVRILDGLTGSGIRAVRIAREVSFRDRDVLIEGVDLKEKSISSAMKLAEINGVNVEFVKSDLNAFMFNRRFDYIDIDPFGSPVSFIQNGILGLKKNGILAVTATDTAALTGSLPRVARRRYGIESARTHFMQEFGARSLMGYIARVASSFERSVKPLFFYTRDHFIRGYVKIGRGAKKADESLKNVGWLHYLSPRPPVVLGDIGQIEDIYTGGRIIGPVWNGSLSLESFTRRCLDVIADHDLGYLLTGESIEKILGTSIREDTLPPGGVDINETSSHLSISPPSVKVISEGLESSGYDRSRSRFSPTQIKTDAPWDVIEAIFREE